MSMPSATPVSSPVYGWAAFSSGHQQTAEEHPGLVCPRCGRQALRRGRPGLTPSAQHRSRGGEPARASDLPRVCQRRIPLRENRHPPPFSLRQPPQESGLLPQAATPPAEILRGDLTARRELGPIHLHPLGAGEFCRKRSAWWMPAGSAAMATARSRCSSTTFGTASSGATTPTIATPSVRNPPKPATSPRPPPSPPRRTRRSSVPPSPRLPVACCC